MSSFAELRKKSNLESLVKNIESKKSGGYEKDDRFWNPTQDAKTGLGSAVIRFLPTPPENDAPWAKVSKHAFKNEETGKWFVEECRSTIGESCAVCSALKPLWNGSEADKKIARERKKKTSYIANVLVIKDPANPENDGELKLFKFGKQIYDKIIAQIKPEFEEDTPMNPFDFWEGADFRIRISKNEGGYRTYDKSTFDTPSALFNGDDEKLEELWNKEVDLRTFMNPENIKSDDELKAKYDAFVNGVAQGSTSAANRVLEELGVDKTPEFKSEKPKSSGKVAESKVEETSSDEDDDWAALLDDL